MRFRKTSFWYKQSLASETPLSAGKKISFFYQNKKRESFQLLHLCSCTQWNGRRNRTFIERKTTALKFLREVREGCRKHVKSSLQLWLEVKREEIGSEAPQIKFKFAVPTSSLVSTLADHPPHCSNCATSDLMSWVWDIRRPVNETVYHCNTLIRYLIEHLFSKLRNKTEKLALKYYLLYLEKKKMRKYACPRK